MLFILENFIIFHKKIEYSIMTDFGGYVTSLSWHPDVMTWRDTDNPRVD